MAVEIEMFPFDLMPDEDSNKEATSTQVMGQCRRCRQKLFVDVYTIYIFHQGRKVFSLLLLIQVSSQGNSLDTRFKSRPQRALLFLSHS